LIFYLAQDEAAAITGANVSERALSAVSRDAACVFLIAFACGYGLRPELRCVKGGGCYCTPMSGGDDHADIMSARQFDKIACNLFHEGILKLFCCGARPL
jgi:hypothetical protein